MQHKISRVSDVQNSKGNGDKGTKLLCKKINKKMHTQ